MRSIVKRFTGQVKRIYLLLTIFIFLFGICYSAGSVSAMVQDNHYNAGTSTVRAAPVTLGLGSTGSSSRSSTNDYGSVTATAGLTFYEISNAPTSATPITVDTSLTAPGSSGSFSVSRGSTAYLWSPQYTVATTLYTGSWLLDMWVLETGKTSGTMTVTITTITSTGTLVSTIVNSQPTSSIGTTKAECKTTFSGSAGSIPANGYIRVALTAPTGTSNPTSFTIYWGSGQLTNFQTPRDYNYVLSIANSASSSYSVSLSAYSSSSIGRLVNMTVSIYAPSTQEIIILNGAFTQSSGSAVNLPATSTLYIRLFVTANAYGSSNVVLLLKITPSTRPFAYDGVSLTVN